MICIIYIILYNIIKFNKHVNIINVDQISDHVFLKKESDKWIGNDLWT